MFVHLKKVKQSYFEHFWDAMKYAGMAFQAGFYFMIHGIYPDMCEWEGGMMIQKLFTIIENKKRKLVNGY